MLSGQSCSSELVTGGLPGVDGLDWESADRYQEQAAKPDHQRLAAEQVDADPLSWEWRVRVAKEIVEVALEAAMRKLGN
jgi:hypothetical protein